MRRTPNQDRALLWYVETNDLIPQLSAHPVYRFKRRSDGQVVEKHIRAIETLFEASRGKIS